MSNPPDVKSLINELAGRFEIVQLLGQGGMGAVYKAIHKQMGRTCAIKLLLPMSSDADLSVERFKREAQLASRIDNPHAVTIYDFGESAGGALYLVMEFIDGQHLGRLISTERPLASDRILRIAGQIAEALNAAHAMGIVHRDLKPENIMVSRKADGSEYVKVLDFGIAKTFDESGGENITKTGFVLGTPYYMSPEQLSGDKLDARSDVYSLALIVYEMFSGQLPFDGDNSQAIMIKRLVSEPRPLRQVAPSVSPEVERVVMKALIKDRNTRTATALGFAEELQAAMVSTQVLSSRHTSRVADDESGRPTIAIAESETRAEPPVAPPPNLITTPDQTAISYPNLDPTIAIEQMGQPNQPEVVRQPSQPLVEAKPVEPGPQHPSAYITNQAVEPGKIAPQGSSPEAVPSTLPFVSEKPSAPPVGYSPAPTPLPVNQGQPFPQHPQQGAGFQAMPTQPQQSPVPAAPYQSAPYPTAPTYGQPATPAPKKSSMGLILGVVAVLALIAIGAGIYLFTPLFKPKPIITTEPPKRTSNGPATKSDEETAVMHYEKGKQHQSQAASLLNSGSAAEALEENKKAITEYSQAVKIKLVYPEAHENLGVAYYSTHDYGPAITELKLAIDQYKQKQQRPSSQVMTNYGLAFFDMKRYAEAAEAFGEAYDIDSTDTDMLAFQGYALQNAGNKDKARLAYNKYLSAAPTGQHVDNIKKILAGQAQPPQDTGN